MTNARDVIQAAAGECWPHCTQEMRERVADAILAALDEAGLEIRARPPLPASEAAIADLIATDPVDLTRYFEALRTEIDQLQDEVSALRIENSRLTAAAKEPKP